MKNRMVIGADIGGTHILAGIVDLEERKLEEASCLRKSVNSNGTADEILDDWASLFNDLMRCNPAQQYLIGIAMPGPFHYEEGISLMKDDHKFGALYGINIKKGWQKS